MGVRDTLMRLPLKHHSTASVHCCWLIFPEMFGSRNELGRKYSEHD